MDRRKFIGRGLTGAAALAFAHSAIGQDKRIEGLKVVRIDGTIQKITKTTPNGNWLFGDKGRKLVRIRSVSLTKINKEHGHNFPHTTTALVGEIMIIWWDPSGNQMPGIFLKEGESFDLPAFYKHDIRVSPKHKGEARFYCTFDHRTDIGDIVESPSDMKYAYE